MIGHSARYETRSRSRGGSASRPCGEWNDDDFDVLADGVVVGRILKVTRYRRTPCRCRMVRSHAAAARRPKPGMVSMLPPRPPKPPPSRPPKPPPPPPAA